MMNHLPPDDTSLPRRFRLRFNPEVNISHVLTSFMLLAGLIAGYVSFRADLDTEKTNTHVTLAQYDVRLTALEHALADRRTEEREFETEMRQSLKDIQAILWDLRGQMPGDQGKGRSR